MEKIMIMELTYHKVFYVKDNNVRFYITIPKTVNTTGIAIDLKNKMGNFDIENNDNKEVIDNLKNLFNYIDNYNITLIVPILDKSLVDILEKIDKDKFELVNNSIGNVINDSYSFLIQENKKVSSQIVIINNDRYKSFITWFVTKYLNRVVTKSLLELIKVYNVNATTYKKMETPFMNFVVGSYNTEVDAKKIVKEEEQPDKMELVKPRQLQPSSGFASYLILIIIAIIVILLVILFVFVF